MGVIKIRHLMKRCLFWHLFYFFVLKLKQNLQKHYIIVIVWRETLIKIIYQKKGDKK